MKDKLGFSREILGVFQGFLALWRDGNKSSALWFTSLMGKLLVTVLLAFAEFERDMIVERTQAGRESAREKGIRVDGRPPKYPRPQMDHAMELLSEHSYSDVARLTGISRSTLTREKRRRKEGEK